LLRDRLAGAPPGAPEDDLLYVAPEQVRGDTATGRSDQYALACAVYHTLAGRPPFERDTRAKLYGAHLLAPPPQLDAQHSVVTSGTSAALLTAMSKDPNDRHQSCGTLIHEALPVDAPPHAHAVTRGRETPDAEPAGSGWRSWWPFAVAALAAAVAFAVLWASVRPDDDQASAQEVSTTIGSPPAPPNNQGGAQNPPQGVVWDAPVLGRQVTQIEVVDDAVVVTDGAGVAMVDGGDGAVRWRQNTGGDVRVASNPPVMAHTGEVLTALELDSGDTSWTADVGRVQSLAALDQTVVAAWADQSAAEIIAVDRTDGATIWREKVAGTGSAAAPAVAAGNHRAYVLHGTTLAAIDPPRAAAGIDALIWQQETEAAWPALVPAGNAVIVATQDGRVCRYAGRDGAMGWCEAVAGAERAQPHVLMAGDLVVIATSDTVVALDSASGRPAWNTSPGGVIDQAVAGRSRVVIAGSAGLRVLDARTGDVTGERQDLAGVTALAMRGGRLYAGSREGGVTAIDVRDLT
jgi:outer membrane protein assembly factor BamB